VGTLAWDSAAPPAAQTPPTRALAQKTKFARKGSVSNGNWQRLAWGGKIWEHRQGGGGMVVAALPRPQFAGGPKRGHWDTPEAGTGFFNPIISMGGHGWRGGGGLFLKWFAGGLIRRPQKEAFGRWQGPVGWRRKNWDLQGLLFRAFSGKAGPKFLADVRGGRGPEGRQPGQRKVPGPRFRRAPCAGRSGGWPPGCLKATCRPKSSGFDPEGTRGLDRGGGPHKLGPEKFSGPAFGFGGPSEGAGTPMPLFPPGRPTT